MISYTITAPPKLAASTVELQHTTQASDYELKVQGDLLEEYYYSQAEFQRSETLASLFASNGVSVFQTLNQGSGGFTSSSWPSVFVTSTTGTNEDDEGSYTYSDSFFSASPVWYFIGSSSIQLTNQTVTQSWDGQFTSSNSDGSTIPTSTTISASKLTTTTQTSEGESTYLSSATTQKVVGTTLSTVAGSKTSTALSTTTAQTSAQIVLTTTAQASQTVVTSASSTITAYDGQTGNRSTATVFLLGANEAIWVPTTTGMGNNLSDFASFVTQSAYTLSPAIITQSGVTADYSVSALYDETTLTQTSTISTVLGSTITLTPSSASVIPRTITRLIQTITTTSVTEELFARSSNIYTPTVSRPTSTTDTMTARLGTMTWQSSFSKSLLSFTTTSAEGVGSVTVSTSSTRGPNFTPNSNEAVENGSSTSSFTTSRTLTFSQTVAPKLMLLEVNSPCQTASSFYEARAALSKMSSIARDVSAQGITFKPFNESKAAQTAVVQSPLTWTYQTGASSVTASAWGGGLTMSLRSNTATSASYTTTSGIWEAAGSAILTQGSFSRLNPVLSAPTGSPALFVQPGTKFTTVGTSTGSVVIAETSVKTADSNEQTRMAQSEAPAWIVGDDSGVLFLTTTRNLTDLPASALF